MTEIGQDIHGFKCIAKEYVDEIQATALTFEHVTTRAPVLVLSCDDDNKVFCTYFRTPVTDSTGVPHILEHSVLNGSEKYPLKEPFLELIKASLYTFLNAMTYDDKTVYPVASRNDQDFRNLMDVYMDAVYSPKITRETFMQEGWHYAMENADDKLKYSGVVYNEMLGATSSPDSMLYQKIQDTLLPDSSYGFNSGGDPEDVPKLTYEEFVDFHRTFYHPSNSKTVLYGNFDVAERLEHLATYMDRYEYQTPSSPIVTQPPFTEPRTARVQFPVAPGSDTAGKSYVVRAWGVGASKDRTEALAREVLNYALTGTQASPLRRALIESQLGEQSIQGLASHMLDNYMIVGIRGTDEEKAADVHALIETTLRELAEDGFDQKTIDAAINTIEFHLREANFGSQPKGLIYALGSAEDWLYDKDPLGPLKYEGPLAAVKEQLAQGGLLEGMITSMLLDNPHRVDLTMVPDEAFESRRIERLEKRLAAEREAMTDDDVTTIIEECKRLEKIQTTPDTTEALASIPKLPLSCIDRKAEELDLKVVDGDVTVMTSEQQTNGIAYLRLAFDGSALPDELLPYVSLFSQAIMQTGTSDVSFIEMTQDIGIQTGGIWADFSTMPVLGEPETVNLLFNCSGKALKEKIPNMLNLMLGALTDADLSDTKRITELVRMIRSGMEAGLKGNGNHFACQRMEAAHTTIGKYNEQIGGVEQFRFLQTLAKDVETNPQAVCETLERIRALVISRAALTVHVTGGGDELAMLQEHLPTLVQGLPDTVVESATRNLPGVPLNEGFIVPSKVQYVCRGINFFELGESYSGKAKVLSNVLGSDYLWHNVRVQGNAYGCFSNYSMTSGIFYLCSYRDPHLDRTVKIFNEIADFLESLNPTRDEFEKLIIGTMGKIDVPLSASQKGGAAFNRRLTKTTQAIIQKQREEVLDCTLDDIRAYAPVFRTFAEKATNCVFGGRDPINKAEGVFDTVTDIFAE